MTDARPSARPEDQRRVLAQLVDDHVGIRLWLGGERQSYLRLVATEAEVIVRATSTGEADVVQRAVNFGQ